MQDKELQEHLTYVTKKKVASVDSNKIIGVTALWQDDTAYLTFYFNKKPTEKELEDIADICTEIIAQFPWGMLEDKYLILENPYLLPKNFLAYKGNEF